MQPLGGAKLPDRQFIGIKFVVAVSVNIEQVALFPDRATDTVVAARTTISAGTERCSFATFDGFAACQMQRRDQRVDCTRHALTGDELLK